MFDKRQWTQIRGTIKFRQISINSVKSNTSVSMITKTRDRIEIRESNITITLSLSLHCYEQTFWTS